jgi:hypothetical protein
MSTQRSYTSHAAVGKKQTQRTDLCLRCSLYGKASSAPPPFFMLHSSKDSELSNCSTVPLLSLLSPKYILKDCTLSVRSPLLTPVHPARVGGRLGTKGPNGGCWFCFYCLFVPVFGSKISACLYPSVAALAAAAVLPASGTAARLMPPMQLVARACSVEFEFPRFETFMIVVLIVA